MLCAEECQGLVTPYFSDIVYEVGTHLAEEHLGIVIDCGNAKFVSQCLRLGPRAIVNRDAFCAMKFAPARKLVASPEPGSENGKPKWFHFPVTVCCGGH